MSHAAVTVADRGPGSIRHISPNTSPVSSLPTTLALSPRPTVTSTVPLTMKNAVSPSSPSAMIVSPALNATFCMNASTGGFEPGDAGYIRSGGLAARRFQRSRIGAGSAWLSSQDRLSPGPRARYSSNRSLVPAGFSGAIEASGFCAATPASRNRLTIG